MTRSVFARQRGSIGAALCLNPTVESDETEIGQQGWDVAFDYSTTDEFLGELRRTIGDEHISMLGLFCHGSYDGSGATPLGGFAIQGSNGPWLHAGNVAFYAAFLGVLNQKMERNGVVYLYGCLVGASDPGRILLMRISSILTPRLVVGFAEEGHLARVQHRPGNFCQLPGMQFSGRWGTHALASAVLARHGRIVPRP